MVLDKCFFTSVLISDRMVWKHVIPRGHPRKRTRQSTETLEDKCPPRWSTSEFHEFGNLFRRARSGACGSLPLSITFRHAPSSTHRTHVTRGPRPSACLSQSLLSQKRSSWAFGEDFAPNKDSLPRSLLVVTVTCAGTDKVFYLVHLLHKEA